MNIQSTDLHYIKKGYEYRTYLDREDDNQKLFHYCFNTMHRCINNQLLKHLK